MPLNDYKKGYVLEKGNCLFASRDKLVFNDSFGSFSLIQLIVDHISDNKNYKHKMLKVVLINI